MILRFADCELDTDRQTLSRGGEPVAVEPQVFDLIRLLAGNPDRLVTRDEIVEAVWGGRVVSESAISARIASARKAVGDDGQRQAVIRTAQRRGLQMAVPVIQTGASAPAGRDRRGSGIRYTLNEQGRSLAYRVDGDGPRVLRISAVPVDLKMEDEIPGLRAYHDLLSAHFSYCRFDPLGYGLSEREGEFRDFEGAADDARAVADTLGWDRFSIMSESGAVFDALHLAAKCPERIERMVVLGGYAEGRSIRGGTGGPDIYKSMLVEGWHQLDGGLAAAFMLAYFPDGPLEDVRGMTRMMQLAGTSERMLEQRDAVNHASALPLLPKIACPTLLVHGRNDAVHPLAQAQKLAAGIPDAELLILESANHLPLPGHPSWGAFRDGVLQFFGR